MPTFFVRFTWGKKITVDAADRAEAIEKIRKLVNHSVVEGRNKTMEDAFDQIEKNITEKKRR